MTQETRSSRSSFHRRQMLQVAASTVAAGTLAGRPLLSAERTRGVQNGRIRQSLVEWCFADHWSLDETCQVAKQLGCTSVELVQPEDWPTLRKHGLQCAISPSHLFVQGMNNPRYHEACLEMLRKRIDQCADAGVKTVITFTGFAEETGEWADGEIPAMDKLPPNRRVIEPDEGLKNCVAGFKRIVGYAERKKINLAIEILNTRVTDHPMKGHPGYQGDHVDYVMDIVNHVGSPRLGILFDLYHVQIMDGDLIRRIHQCGDAIHHVHVAGNPGRGELDDSQEINFAPCMKALLDIGYQGFVGQEFIPTRDPLEGLAQAIRVCDV